MPETEETEETIPDYKKSWDNYKTTPVRQLDLFLEDILDVLNNKPIGEAIQYVRGLRDGNRFGRERPEIKKIGEN